MYYNTNKEKGETLKQSRKKTDSQEAAILQFITDSSQRHFSPTLIWTVLHSRGIPLTSVRRALTNLTNEGYLVKTDFMVDGWYGKKEHTWRLK